MGGGGDARSRNKFIETSSNFLEWHVMRKTRSWSWVWFSGLWQLIIKKWDYIKILQNYFTIMVTITTHCLKSTVGIGNYIIFYRYLGTRLQSRQYNRDGQLVLESHCSAELSYIPNKTHLPVRFFRCLIRDITKLWTQDCSCLSLVKHLIYSSHGNLS